MEALEKDNVVYEAVEIEDDEEASMDEMDDRKCGILFLFAPRYLVFVGVGFTICTDKWK